MSNASKEVFNLVVPSRVNVTIAIVKELMTQAPTRRRGSRRRPAPGNPVQKNDAKSGSKLSQGTAPSDTDSFNELKGKVVWAPACHFGIEVPGMFYRWDIFF